MLIMMRYEAHELMIFQEKNFSPLDILLDYILEVSLLYSIVGHATKREATPID